MKIKGYTQKGKRDYNQDFYIIADNYGIICDGVGGNKNGDVASKFVAEYVAERLNNEELSTDDVIDIIDSAQRELAEKGKESMEFFDMATTIALFVRSGDQFIVSNIGDSPVFLFTQDGDTFRTKDHSVVQELLDKGEITEEEFINHPKKNYITRVLRADENNNGVKAYAENAPIKLVEGDYALICSDGVLETYDDVADLQSLVTDPAVGIDDKIDVISERCDAFSDDNNTAILIQLETNDFINKSKENNSQNAQATSQKIENNAEEPIDQNKSKQSKAKSKKPKTLAYFLTPMLVILAGYAIYRYVNTSKRIEFESIETSTAGNPNTQSTPAQNTTSTTSSNPAQAVQQPSEHHRPPQPTQSTANIAPNRPVQSSDQPRKKPKRSNTDIQKKDNNTVDAKVEITNPVKPKDTTTQTSEAKKESAKNNNKKVEIKNEDKPKTTETKADQEMSPAKDDTEKVINDE